MTAAEFASALKSYRARYGLTQAQAAAGLGVSVRTWQNWEIARNRPPEYAVATLMPLLARPPGSGRLTHAASFGPAPATKSRRSRPGKKSPAAADSSLQSAEEDAVTLETHLL